MMSARADASSKRAAAPCVAVAVSLLVHVAVLFGVGTRPGQAGVHDPVAAGLTVRVVAPLQSSLHAMRTTPKPVAAARSARAVTPAPSAPDAPASGHDVARPGTGEGILPGILAFDPGAYLPPSAVERSAVPLAEASLDLLLLTGTQPGLWQVKLYIGESGTVDEIEVLEAQGDPSNTAELTDMLRTLRFEPAIAAGAPVRSQKLLEFSFEPAPQISGLAPGLSAAGR